MRLSSFPIRFAASVMLNGDGAHLQAQVSFQVGINKSFSPLTSRGGNVDDVGYVVQPYPPPPPPIRLYTLSSPAPGRYLATGWNSPAAARTKYLAVVR